MPEKLNELEAKILHDKNIDEREQWHRKKYQGLMIQELRNAYESKCEIAAIDFPTSSGKSYLTRRLHEILGLGAGTENENRVILSYATKELCKTAMDDLQTIPGVRPLWLKGMDQQVREIRDLEENAAFHILCRDISVAINMYEKKKERASDSGYQAREMSGKEVEERFRSLFAVVENNRKVSKNNENLPVAAEKETPDFMPEFKELYTELYDVMLSDAGLITDTIKQYFQDLTFDDANVVVLTHAKSMWSILPYRKYYLTDIPEVDPVRVEDGEGNQERGQGQGEDDENAGGGKNTILVIDEVEKFIETYDNSILENAKKSYVDFVKYAASVTAVSHSYLLTIYMDNADSAIRYAEERKEKNKNNQKLVNYIGQKENELKSCLKQAQSSYGQFIKQADANQDKYLGYQVQFCIDQVEDWSKKQLPRYTALNGRFYNPDKKAFCHVRQERYGKCVYLNDEEGDADYSITEFVKDTHALFSSFFGYLRHAVEMEVIGSQIRETQRKPMSRSEILNHMAEEIRFDTNPEKAFTINSVFQPRPILPNPRNEKMDWDWYESGVSQYRIRQAAGNIPGLIRITAARIPQTGSAWLARCAQNTRITYLLSATLHLRSFYNADWDYLSRYCRIYTVRKDVLDAIQHHLFCVRDLESRDTEYQVAVLQPPEGLMAVNQEDPGVDNPNKNPATRPLLKEYMQMAVNGIVRRQEELCRDLDKGNMGRDGQVLCDAECGVCFEAVLSSTFYREKSRKPLVDKSEIAVPDGYRLVFLQLDKSGVNEVSGATENITIKRDGDTFTIGLPKKTIAFLMTAYRSGDRSYNVDIHSCGHQYSLAGMLVMKVTNLVPVSYDPRVEGSRIRKYYFHLEKNLDCLFLGLLQQRMTQLPPLGTGLDTERSQNFPVLTGKQFAFIEKYADDLSKRVLERKPSRFRQNDLYGRGEIYSSYKQTAQAYYEQALGRFRNGRRPPFALIAVEDGIITKHCFHPNMVEAPYPYEAGRVLDYIRDSWQPDNGNLPAVAYPGRQKKQHDRLYKRIKASIPQYKLALSEPGLSREEREKLIGNLRNGIREQEGFKTESVDFTCTKLPGGETAASSHVFIQETGDSRTRNQPGSQGETIEPFTMVSTWYCCDMDGAAGDYKPVRLISPGIDIPGKCLPRKEGQPFGIGELMKLLYVVSPVEFSRQFPAISVNTLDKMIERNMFPYPPTYDGYTTAKGEVGERVFEGLFHEIARISETPLRIVPSEAYPQVYEDFDYFVRVGDIIVGAVNVKFADEFTEERSGETRDKKIGRMKMLPGIADPDHLKAVYLEIMPTASNVGREIKSNRINGLESKQVEMFTRNVLGMDKNVIIQETANVVRQMEEFFDAYAYVKPESPENGDPDAGNPEGI